MAQRQNRRWWQSDAVQVTAVVILGAIVLYAFRDFVMDVVTFMLIIAAMIGLIFYILFGPSRWKRKR